MHLPDLVSDLAVILLTGGIITVIFKRLNLRWCWGTYWQAS